MSGTGRRVIAIGDIHGCLRALDTLIACVALTESDVVITLGDAIDRGPGTRGVLDRLIALHDAGQLIALRGNHELMFLRSRASWPDEQGWRACGGEPTLASYAPTGRDGRLGDVPDRHWKFLAARCVDWHETDTHIFVHAGLHPARPPDQQTEFDLFWMPLENRGPHSSGKVVICGHTEQRCHLPLDLGHTVCLDTAAYDGGWLTALDVHSGKYWQANQAGASRAGRLVGRPVP
jgi:serine/threonine protein phosphatase 1